MNKQKLLALALSAAATFAAGYFGFEPIQEQLNSPAPDVDIEVHVPEQTQHSHPTHKHKDWAPVIDAKIKANNEEYH